MRIVVCRLMFYSSCYHPIMKSQRQTTLTQISANLTVQGVISIMFPIFKPFYTKARDRMVNGEYCGIQCIYGYI